MHPGILSGVLGMMEKVSVSKLMARHTQIRKGRRPYRVSTLLKKEKPMHDVPELLADVPEKTAAVKTALKSSTIQSALDIATQRASKAAVSSGVKRRAGEDVMDYVRRAAPRHHKQVETFTKGLGRAKASESTALRAFEAGERAKKRLGESALRKFESAQVSKVAAASYAGFFDELDKIAGMGVDLRLLKKNGVTEINMPTEESLAHAKAKLERSQRVGADLKIKPPDPNIRAVATKVKG